MVWYIHPAFLSKLADLRQSHFSVHDFTKQAFTFVRQNRNVVHTRLSIVLTLQAQRASVMVVWVVEHVFLPHGASKRLWSFSMVFSSKWSKGL